MKLISKIFLLLLLFGVEAEHEDNEKSEATKLKERVMKNCSVCETGNGRFFGDAFFTVFEFFDNLMIKNQEKLTRQALNREKKKAPAGGESDKYNSEPFTDPQGAGSSMSEMSVYPVKMIGGYQNYYPNPGHFPSNMSTAMMEMKPKDPEPNSQNILIHIWNGFKSQIDTILFSKFLLKIIVFKKIVKFMTLICLLFFLPSLKQDSSGRIFRDDYENEIDNRTGFDHRSRHLLHFVILAVESLTLPTMIFCVGELDMYCRFGGMFDLVDQSYTVDKIYRIFLPNANLTTTTTTNQPFTTISSPDFIEDDELDEQESSYIDYVIDNAVDPIQDEKLDQEVEDEEESPSYVDYVFDSVGLTGEKNDQDLEDFDEGSGEFEEDLEGSGSGFLNVGLVNNVELLDSDYNFDSSGEIEIITDQFDELEEISKYEDFPISKNFEALED